MNNLEKIKINQTSYLFHVEDALELIGLMKLAKSEEAILKLDEICKRNNLFFNDNHDFANCLVMNLASCILQVENDMKNRDTLSDSAVWMKQVSETASVNDQINLIRQRILQICNLILDVRTNKDNYLVKDILAYIMDNYQAEGFGNIEIADYFGISNAYLSTIFKEKTGVKLVEYIHQLRVEKAKELLITSDLNVEQISSAVGCNSLTLWRLFKKYVGIAPIQYREDNNRNRS